MKHLRLFEDTQNSKIDLFDYFREKDKFKKSENKILNLIIEYIEINSDYFIKEYSFELKKLGSIELEEPFTLHLIFQFGTRITLNTDDFNDLLDFIEDPEAYKYAKKFNI